MEKKKFERLFPRANPDALDLLDRMLAFDPNERIGVEEALEHRYLSIWHDATDEPKCPTPFDFSFEVVEDIPQMRQMILDEVKRFRSSVRTPAQPHQNQAPQVPMPDPAAKSSVVRDPNPDPRNNASEPQDLADELGYR